ncbi:MAG: hypothetical protein U0231_14850 [Nitrospiraceae bacterium]
MVKKLDEIANDTFVRVFEHSGLVCALASEEMEKPIHMPQQGPRQVHAPVRSARRPNKT